jgi:hypothetical protein
MSRAYIVYILMFGLLGGGLWLILTLGQAVRAPDDLSGDWLVVWANTPPPQSDEPTLHVDQSGRFFMVKFGTRQPVGMTLQRGWHGAGDGRNLGMRLDGAIWSLNVTGDIPLNETKHIPEISIELVGPSRHYGVARRVNPDGSPATRPAGIAHAR